jgi:peptidoglycan/xylan/chitin deacetylase (PgdA/CDA1 family)
MIHGLVVILTIAAAAAVLLLLATYLGELRGPRLVCLMYHRLAPASFYATVRGGERTFTLPTESFAEQLAELRAQGYRFVTPSQASAFLDGRDPSTQPAVLITFDDGCVSVFREAIPILKEHQACATAFVTTDPASHVFRLEYGVDRRMTDDELREADRSGLNIESHGVTHRPLSGLSDDELRFELTESRRRLEAVLGRPVQHLAIPGNWYDARVLKFAREAGYSAAWCSRPGAVRPGLRAFGLPRVNVDGYMGLGAFRAQLRPAGIAWRRMLLTLRGLPGRLLGPTKWLPMRAMILRGVPGGHVSIRQVAVLSVVTLGVLVVLWWRLLHG